MDIQNIVQQLRDQRNRLDAAILALEETLSAPRRGRPPKAASTPATRRGPRKMSAAARAKISAAQRARWAKQKGESIAKKATGAKKASGRSRMSAAARKRLSELMRKRWAERKKQSAK